MRLRAPRRLVAIAALIATLLGLAACSSSTTSGKGTTPSLVGSYHLVRDVGGTQVKSGATVTLTLKADGTLTLLAVQTGERLTDHGTWQRSGGAITVEFVEQGIKGTGQLDFDGTTLRLPVLMFGEGKGVSEWRRVGASTPSPTNSAPPIAKGGWDRWDLDSDAAAAGTKAYSDAIAKGTDRKDAVAAAVAKVKTMPDVAGADVSGNGLNVRIRYTDGQTEDIVTERLQPSEAMGGSWSAPAGRTTDNGSCATLPGASPDPREPGREGVNPGGGYGVTIYDQNQQPKPVTSADSPADRRALLISPQYDVPHPMHGSQETIRGIAGDNIECVQASLTKVGYRVDTILGHVDNGKRVDVGDAAIQELITKLTTQKYGVVYFLGHGYLEANGAHFAGMWMGAVDLDRPEIKTILNGKKVDRALAVKIKEAYAKIFGLTWDPANPPIDLAPDGDGTASIVVKPELFAQLRGKGADFSSSLMLIDACSSGSDERMVQAAAPKAYVGWKVEMSGEFISRASETLFDLLTDKARTVRAATQLWQIHEKWKATGPALDSNVDWASLVTSGTGGHEYSRIDAQTWILIFRLRHGPSSATSDITQSAKMIRACYAQVWKLHKGALASPACHALEYGNLQPTEGQVVDALFEVGVQAIGGGAGRWTLAD